MLTGQAVLIMPVDPPVQLNFLSLVWKGLAVHPGEIIYTIFKEYNVAWKFLFMKIINSIAWMWIGLTGMIFVKIAGFFPNNVFEFIIFRWL